MYYRNMLLTQQQLPVMCEVCCNSLSFSETMCRLTELAQPLHQRIPFLPSEMGENHVYTI